MTEFKKVTEENKPSALLPAMGLVLALCTAAICYATAPAIGDFLRENDRVSEQIADIQDRDLYLMIGIMMWFISLALIVMFVSLIQGRDTLIDQESKTVRLKEKDLTPRKIRRYEAKIAHQRAQKIKALKRMRDKQEAIDRKAKEKKADS
ncbi:MAG: hypothetical protein H6673_04085 [Anaerolineales bacterium]|nr:hypothetical protein [Anaerolineales bacterium]